MPLTFFPSMKISLTHLMPGRRPDTSSMASQAATAARVVIFTASEGASCSGRSSRLK